MKEQTLLLLCAFPCALSSLSVQNRLHQRLVRVVEDALERDTFLTADEAKNFGLIDTVVDKREAVKEESE